jgi:YfiH family protein
MKFLTTDLNEISWVRHGFFTRLGGVSTGIYTSLNCGLKTDDSLVHVRANRAKAAEMLEIKPTHLAIAKQVHGTKTVHVTKPWAMESAPEADALVTAEPGIGLGVLTADCVPVLFADKKKKIIGAAHAGWRGALDGILESTVAEMEKLGSKPADIEAAIGPCIGPRSYEVKDAFKKPFLEQDKTYEKFFNPSPRPGHLIFDLPGYATARLKKAGIKTIHDMAQDTMTNEAVYFSNRRTFLKSEKGFGLQVSIISIKSNC